jgi:cyclopropane fatty-acyl-phospholipid synthase-like methyltransferase
MVHKMSYKYKDIDLYKEIYSRKTAYGNAGGRYVEIIYDFIVEKKVSLILDFGCGQGSLKKALALKSIHIDEYDPSIKNKNVIYKPAYDLVITTDVLEHIHEDEIDIFLHDILSLSASYMIHVISTRPAQNILPDGTNAHKTIKNQNWWQNKIFESTKYKTSIIDANIYKQYFVDTHTCVIIAEKC